MNPGGRPPGPQVGFFAMRAASRERPKLRRCLAPGHNHEFLTVKAIRLCDAGRQQVARLDASYADGVPITFVTGRPSRMSEAGVA